MPIPNNTINSVSSNLRDFLLNKNLVPVYPQISTSLNGGPRIGEPILDTMVGTGNVVQPFGLPLQTEGIKHMELNLSTNRFKNNSSIANNLNNINYLEPNVGSFGSSTFPHGIESYPTGSNQEVYQYGLMGKTLEGGYRKNATIKNLYLDASKQVDTSDWISLQTMPVSQQIKGYLDTYGGLNLGGSGAIQAANVIGSVLNGQGLGLAKGGVVTNFDLRSSLAGRVLGATGLINDTKLGMIGGQQLALSLANNAAFNLEQSLLGKLNAQDNVLSLVKNGTLAGFRPNYQITVPSGGVGRVLDYTARILGFTLPKSYLNDAGSIFQNENGDSENIKRANSMILNTGKGQVVALLTNARANLAVNSSTTPFRSGYAPGFTDNKGQIQITNGIIYAFGNGEGHLVNPLTASDGVIPDISYLREGKVESSGFKDFSSEYLEDFTESKIRKPSFTWGSDKGGLTNSFPEYKPFVGDKKSLLSKTQKLFNSKGMLNLVTSKGDMSINTPSQIQTAVVGNGISKGNAVLKGTSFNEDGQWATSFKTAEETYCRSWTTISRYEKVQNLVRSSGLSSIVPYRNKINGSVLDEYGFPQIAPYSSDSPDNPKKYMFSLENLAWSDQVQDLLPCEIGPGDLITGKKGRIMWFPPYNIQFSENSTVSWESNNFVGRGESIYSYNNTERSGNLSFQIIVDHSSYTNSFRGNNGPDDHYVASFFAGCVEPSSKFADKLTVSEISSLSTDNVTKPQEKVVTPELQPPDIEVYFPNDVAVVPSTYENGLSGLTSADTINYSVNATGLGFGLGTYQSSFTAGSTESWPDRYNFGLNGLGADGKKIDIDGIPFNGFLDSGLIIYLNEFLNTKCPSCVVEVTGYASAQGTASVNTTLADARANNVIASLKPQLHTNLSGADKDKRFKKMPGGVLTSSCVAATGSDTDSEACKRDRKAVIRFRFDKNLLPKEQIGADPVVKPPLKKINTKITNRFYTECNYFEQLTDNDYFVFDKFRDKIKYFHPAFHSTTPEGLNSRLTFLNQCTRQGPTLEGQGANNLSFGRAPICILRIGDFYNTKIIIDNISIDYEPLVWDLNPEGVGVQPMIANVTMSFKFIGGSTLEGPINKLQNALSFNYYANTQVYDPRADYIAKGEKLEYRIVNGIKNPNNEVQTVTTEEIIANTPTLNQESANNKASSAQEQANTAKEDLDSISILSVVFDGTKSTTNKNITGTITLKASIASVLSEDYYFKLKIFDKNNSQFDVGVDIVTATPSNQDFVFTVNITPFVNDAAVSLYQMELSFGNTKKIYHKISI